MGTKTGNCCFSNRRHSTRPNDGVPARASLSARTRTMPSPLALPLLLLLAAAASAQPAAETEGAETPAPAPPPAAFPRLGRFDPCAPPGSASKGRGFYVGVAFWPGGTPSDWGPATGVGAGTGAAAAALLPCRAAPGAPGGFNGTGLGDRPFLAARAPGSGWAAFQVKVDTVAALTFNASEVR